MPVQHLEQYFGFFVILPQVAHGCSGLGFLRGVLQQDTEQYFGFIVIVPHVGHGCFIVHLLKIEDLRRLAVIVFRQHRLEPLEVKNRKTALDGCVT